MPLHALALVLLAALLHAAWNLGAKKAGGDHHFVLAGALAAALLWLPLVAPAAWEMLPRWSALAWTMALASALLHLVYFRTLLLGYRVSDLNIVYPVARGSGPAISALAALALLDEQLGLAGGLGLAAVIAGIVLMAAGPALWKPGDAAAKRRRWLGILWGSATGLTIAGYTVADGYSVKVLQLSPLLLYYMSNLLLVPFGLPAVLRERAGFLPALRRQWPYVLMMAVLSPLAYVLVLYALQLAPLSRVAPARELSMLVAALAGGKLLGEGERGWRLVGAALIAGGVIALSVV
ncbi:EamA family transporter [Pelomonas sp. KK5]|uniref:EamA family transporter n=1 Tax=Pelomonas sp. KK5 TaxID=1855730 RepID=UPI00097C3BAB|nr:EamA family transporter [Pelomonas sp. KK5]